MPALPATGPGKTVSEDVEFEIAAELSVDVRGHRIGIALPEAGKRKPSLEAAAEVAAM